MSPVIGQRIALSEKWPSIFVVAERGNDFEMGAVKEGGWAKMGREERGTWMPLRVSLVMCEHAGKYIHTHSNIYEGAHGATHMSHRVCTFMQFVTRGTGIPPLK